MRELSIEIRTNGAHPIGTLLTIVDGENVDTMDISDWTLTDITVDGERGRVNMTLRPDNMLFIRERQR